jgi:type II secretory pathway component PulK
MLASYRRQHLVEFLTRLLVELDVDEELAQVAVQEALDFESSLIDVSHFSIKIKA